MLSIGFDAVGRRVDDRGDRGGGCCMIITRVAGVLYECVFSMSAESSGDVFFLHKMGAL